MGNASSSWNKADRIIDSLISGLDLEGVVFSAEGFVAKDSTDSTKEWLQYFVHKAIECFREGRQFFESGLFDCAKNKFHEAIGAMMKFSIPSVRKVPCASLLSVCEALSFVQKRCFCLGHENPDLGSQQRRYSFGTLTALTEYGCFENDSQYQLLVDSLLVMTLTCLSECYELLGLSANAERISNARMQLQKALYGTDSMKYAFSCKNLRGFCSCSDSDQCACMMKGGCSKAESLPCSQGSNHSATAMSSSLSHNVEKVGQEGGDRDGYSSDFEMGMGMVMTTDDEGGD